MRVRSCSGLELEQGGRRDESPLLAYRALFFPQPIALEHNEGGVHMWEGQKESRGAMAGFESVSL